MSETEPITAAELPQSDTMKYTETIIPQGDAKDAKVETPGMVESISFLMERCSTEDLQKIIEVAKNKIGVATSESASDKIIELLEQVTEQSELQKVDKLITDKLVTLKGDKSFGMRCAKKSAQQKGGYYKDKIKEGIKACYGNRNAQHDFSVCPDARDIIIKYLKDQGFEAWEGYHSGDISMKIVPDPETLLKRLYELNDEKVE